MRGNGRIFQRKGSAFLWCAYYLRGKEYRESTGETDPNKADKFLKRRLKEVGADQIGAKAFVGPQQQHIKISELLDALVTCRSEFVTADAAGGIGVFPLDRSGVGGISVDVAAEFAS